jgi:hypothetical protein
VTRRDITTSVCCLEGICKKRFRFGNSSCPGTCFRMDRGGSFGKFRTSHIRLHQSSGTGQCPPFLHDGWQERTACSFQTEVRRPGVEGAGTGEQVRLPGPVRARADGGRLSRTGLVWPCATVGCGRNCPGTHCGRPRGRAAAAAGRVREHVDLSSPGASVINPVKCGVRAHGKRFPHVLYFKEDQ